MIQGSADELSAHARRCLHVCMNMECGEQILAAIESTSLRLELALFHCIIFHSIQCNQGVYNRGLPIAPIVSASAVSHCKWW
jgi:hypothetical protein